MNQEGLLVDKLYKNGCINYARSDMASNITEFLVSLIVSDSGLWIISFCKTRLKKTEYERIYSVQ